MPDKDFLGLFAVALSLVGHGAYFWSIYKKRTRPHAFSWIIWSLLTGIGFFVQIDKGAGPGAWAMGVTSGGCIVGAVLALFYGERDIRKSDILAFAGGLSAIPLWYVTKDPLSAAIVITIVEVFAFYPTFRKSYFKPHEELALAYILDVVKYMISLLAMEHYSLAALLYPVFIIVLQSGFVVMLFWRRAALARVIK